MKISGEKIKKVREEKGISRAELSRTSGISIRTLENWESGVRNPRNFDIIDTLARALNVEISSFYDDEYLSELNIQALDNTERFMDSEEGEADLIESIERIYEEQGLTGILKLLDRFVYTLGIPAARKIIEEYENE